MNYDFLITGTIRIRADSLEDARKKLWNTDFKPWPLLLNSADPLEYNFKDIVPASKEDVLKIYRQIVEEDKELLDQLED